MTLTDQMVNLFESAFYLPGLEWYLILLSIALGLAFGAIWLAGYRPPLFSKPFLWVIGAVSAFLTWIAICFIQVPLQYWTGRVLIHFFDQRTLVNWLLFAGIPQILLSGLVQEGAKLVPVVFYWWRNQKNIAPVFGLILGAVSGAGFGVFEAVWVHNSIFASGWSWQTVDTYGYLAFLGFWERFFTVGFHIAVSALAGYGLAKGWGWQFYLVSSFLHGLGNYSAVLIQNGNLTGPQAEIYVAGIAIIVSAAALWLRWRKPEPAQAE